MSPVPLFCHSPPPGATLESRKNELIIYCLVYPPPWGGTFGLLGGVGQKRGNFGHLGGGRQKRANFGNFGVPPPGLGVYPETGLLATWGTPPGQAPQAAPRYPPQAAPRYPPPARGTPQAPPRYPPRQPPGTPPLARGTPQAAPRPYLHDAVYGPLALPGARTAVLQC